MRRPRIRRETPAPSNPASGPIWSRSTRTSSPAPRRGSRISLPSSPWSGARSSTAAESRASAGELRRAQPEEAKGRRVLHPAIPLVVEDVLVARTHGGQGGAVGHHFAEIADGVAERHEREAQAPQQAPETALHGRHQIAEVQPQALLVEVPEEAEQQ